MKSLRNFFISVFFCGLSFCAFPQMRVDAGAYQTIEAEIPVSCLQMEGDEKQVYEIVIEPENNSFPVPKSDVLKITEDGNGKFQIDIDEPGVFTYKVYERVGTNQNIKYDSKVYNVSVYVENAQADNLICFIAVTINDSGRKPERLEFQNVILNKEAISTTTITDSSITKIQTEETVSTEDSAVDVEMEVSTTTTPTEMLSVDTNLTATTSVTTTTSTNPRIRREKPPSVMDSIQELFNPTTGDTMPIGILSVLLVLGAVGISLSLKKQDKEGGQNYEGEKENQR